MLFKPSGETLWKRMEWSAGSTPQTSGVRSLFDAVLWLTEMLIPTGAALSADSHCW